MRVFVVLLCYIIFVNAASDSSEDQVHFGAAFVDPFAPTTVNFNEIFTNSLSMLNEEPLTALGKDEDFHLNNLPSSLVEFRVVTPATTTTTTPKPRFPTASELKKNSTTTTSAPSSTEASTETSTPEQKLPPKAAALKSPAPKVEVLPLKAQRGVLDLIFPASRVRTFKSVFDTVRRILSETF